MPTKAAKTRRRSPASPDKEKKPAYVPTCPPSVTKVQLLRILEEWRSVFDTLTDSVIVLSPEGKIIRCNRSLAEFVHLPFSQVIGYDVVKVIPEFMGFFKILERHTNHTTKVLELGERWYQVAADPLLNREGSLSGWTCIIADINSKKKTEDLLRQTNQTLQALIHSSPLAIITFDRTGKIQFWNPAAEKIFGYTSSEVSGNLMPFVSGGKMKEAQTMLRAIAAGNVYEGVFHEWKRKDGHPVDVQFFAAPIRDHEGRTEAFMGIVEDVTSALRLEEDLRQSEERFRLLFDHSPLGIAIFRHRILLYANRTCLEMFGYGENSEIMETEVRRYVAPLSFPLLEEVITKIQEKQPRSLGFEITALKKNGTPFPAHVEVGSIVLPEGPAKVVFVVDMSERKTLEEKLVQAHKMESLGQLAAGISHDFNNILTGIMGYADMALSHVQSPHPQFDSIERIRQLASRAASITHKLLAFSRNQVLEPHNVDLNKVITDFLKLLGNTLGESVEIQFQPDPAIKAIRADSSQMEQVLMNLCLNARDAMPDGGRIVIRTRSLDLNETEPSNPSAPPIGRYSLLEVEDTGCGIKREVKEKIFEPFFTTKEPGKGTGLGLSMVHGIIVQQGGFITVESEPGAGALFRIYLPEASPSIPETPPAPQPPMVPGAESILIMEDDDDVRELIVVLLGDLGYKTIAVGEPEKGLRLLEEKRDEVALVISDIVMPHYDGQQLKDKIRELRSPAKILFISGYSEGEVSQHTLLEGAHFVAKPFTPAQLASRIREILDRG